MRNITSNQNGFHLIGLVIVIAVIGTIGFVGWKVATSGNNTSDNGQKNNVQIASGENGSTAFVEWSFNGGEWTHMGTAPQCKEPLSVQAPIDLSKANAKLLPGQVRGGDYKPHGGLGLDYAKYQNKVDVVAMHDMYLYRGSRYIEAGEVQYLLDFMDSCGILYRYDHLLTLSPDFAKYVNVLPEPKKDESRTEKFQDHVLIKAGTVIATEVGFRGMQNPGFDIGVYDLRQHNPVSQTSLFKTDPARVQDKEQSYFAVCWFDLLPSKDKEVVKALPLRNPREDTSDFCTL